MPAATSESLLSSALSKVKHRNHDLVKRDVMTTLLHYRGNYEYYNINNELCMTPSINIYRLSSQT